MDESMRERILDEEHLRLLRIGYFIQGGMTAFMSLFGLLYVFMGILVFSSFGNMPGSGGAAPPRFFGYIVALFGGLWTLGGATFATLQFLTARALGDPRWRTLCLVTAVVSCVFIPYGTVLGICTFVVLGRPGVRKLFNGGPATSEPGVLPPSAPTSSGTSA